MRFLSLISIVVLLMTPVTTLASENAGKAFGAGVPCTLDDGSVKTMPRELCKLNGGTHK